MKHFPANDQPAIRPAHIRVSLHPVWFPVGLTLVALFLGTAYVVTVKQTTFWGSEIARIFDLNEEANVPTWLVPRSGWSLPFWPL